MSDNVRSLNEVKRPSQFSPEEIRVLKECNRESFYRRCLPLATISGVGAYFGVKTGFLKGNPRYGPTPKVVVAVILGYFIGKFSYQQKCAEKLMQLPNSQIGEMLRQRRKGFMQETLEPGVGPTMSLPAFSDIGKVDKYSDLGSPRSIYDMDTSRPENEGLDDSHRPTIDVSSAAPIYEEEMPPMQKQVTTYEELRKKNRDEYQQKRTSSFSRGPLSEGGPSQTSVSKEDAPETTTRKNKYGDVLL